jgi:ribosomal protein S18 acetylase RimI-like enzyme
MTDAEQQGEVRIRRGAAGDGATLAGFNRAAAEETEGLLLDPATAVRGVELLLAHPDRGFYLVAEADGEIRAALMVTTEWSDWRAGTFWWIQSVYVRPAHRRRGLFRALYRHVRDRAREAGDVCGLRLYVERDNAGAQRTYESVGMRETGYRLWEVGFDSP